jgi:mRNA-degrading endonuclease RelE of RelBE toxin-antitoxin system
VAHDLTFLQAAVDDLDKLVKHNPALAVQLIVEHFPAIARDPKGSGEKKQGELSHVRAYPFTFRGVAYRVVYEVDEPRQRVAVVAIGLHDVAYRRARGR